MLRNNVEEGQFGTLLALNLPLILADDAEEDEQYFIPTTTKPQSVNRQPPLVSAVTEQVQTKTTTQNDLETENKYHTYYTENERRELIDSEYSSSNDGQYFIFQLEQLFFLHPSRMT